MSDNINRPRGEYRYFVEDERMWRRDFEDIDYYTERIPEIKVIDKGVILPVKKTGGWLAGGVCGKDGGFIDGHKRLQDLNKMLGLARDNMFLKNTCVLQPYKIPDNCGYINETVVYGGLLIPHFGHFVSESLSRMWYFIENPDCGLKFAFITRTPPDEFPAAFIEYLYLLGLKRENIILLGAPARFDAVIVPEQSHYLRSFYTGKAALVYNKIRDNVLPGQHKKIYLTRQKLGNNDTVNEAYFAGFYKSAGYEIIAPEELSVREQTALMAGADEVVCVSGSLHNHILFCKDGIDITVLNRNNRIGNILPWVNQIKRAKVTFIDVSMNFLPALTAKSVYFLAPTVYWNRYCGGADTDAVKIKPVTEDFYSSGDFASLSLEYMKQWAANIASLDEFTYRSISEYEPIYVADIALGIMKYLMNIEYSDNFAAALRQKLRPREAPERAYSFVFPFGEIPRDSRIIIHGTDDAYKDYIDQINDTKWCGITAVIGYHSDKEKSYKGYELCPLHTIFSFCETDYDYILIAAPKDDYAAVKTTETLIRKGISGNKIICRKDRNIYSCTGIIQRFVDASEKRRYLEIGVSDGLNFSEISADFKAGVDPAAPARPVKRNLNERCIYIEMNIDTFFGSLRQQPFFDVPFDVVFINGFSEYNETYEAVISSIRLLAENGVIIIRGCIPVNNAAEHSLWKAVARIRAERGDFYVATLDTDTGCAVIMKTGTDNEPRSPADETERLTVRDFIGGADKLINLKPPEEIYNILRLIGAE